jgi:preprotein translocase subunit YajC
VKIPDYISPVVAHRVWRWDAARLASLNGEQWLPDRAVEARCRVVPAARYLRGVHRSTEVPDRNCTCGVYAAKNLEHLRQLGYADRGICGEVYLWGKVVEHKLGWRAQFAYPKNLVLPLHLLPFTLAELNARLLALIAFGIDISVLHNRESMRLWKHGQGYDANGLDYIINLRRRHYIQEQHERTLKKGDRVALLGHGIAVVQQVDDKAAVVVLGNGVSLRIARENIVLNKPNMRWECEQSLS